MRPQDVRVAIFKQPLSLAELSQPSHLLAQRLLLNSYEQDLILLPEDGKLDMADFIMMTVAQRE